MAGTVYFSRILQFYVVCLGVLFCQAVVAALPSPSHGLLPRPWSAPSPGAGR